MVAQARKQVPDFDGTALFLHFGIGVSQGWEGWVPFKWVDEDRIVPVATIQSKNEVVPEICGVETIILLIWVRQNGEREVVREAVLLWQTGVPSMLVKEGE